jgi:hypothetical protein
MKEAADAEHHRDTRCEGDCADLCDAGRGVKDECRAERDSDDERGQMGDSPKPRRAGRRRIPDRPFEGASSQRAPPAGLA